MKLSNEILIALSDAPMSTEALMHELDAGKLSVAIACGHLRKSRRIAVDERGLWHLLPWAGPSAGADQVVDVAPAAAPVPVEATVAARAARAANPARVLAVLVAAGIVTHDQVAAAEQLVR